MGRPKRYRERIEFEMHSVQAKSVQSLISQVLQKDFGCSRLEAEVLSRRSLGWLRTLGVPEVPGQVRLAVPATPSRRYARERRMMATITAVDVGEDTEIWRVYGLAALQRRRLLRWLYEIYRSGGWASLAELAAWANLTPTALGARLAPIRRHGIWLPHVGGPEPREDRLALEPWLVARYLEEGQVESLRAQCGLTLASWENLLYRFLQVVSAADIGTDPEVLANRYGFSILEVRQLLAVSRKYRRQPLFKELAASYGDFICSSSSAEIEDELTKLYGFSPVSARLYHEWLAELAARLSTTSLGPGEMIFLAISADEGARARLVEARHIPVRLRYFTEDDALEGPYGDCPSKVSGLKFNRLVRYATEARVQGALLTLPDLAVLMGIHVDAIRRQLAAHPEVVVPTRGRLKDIGRGVTHKAEIVEMYLQMHTETEIVERTGHSYESVEAYLREFARVVTLADQGMNPVMIRRVTGRSMALVKAYLELYRRYDKPDYHFRLAQLRNVFTRGEILGQKKGRHFPYLIGGAER